MAKIKTQYVCQSCGYTSAKWLGRCLGCEEWNSFVEETSSPPTVDTALPSLRNPDLQSPQVSGAGGGLSRVALIDRDPKAPSDSPITPAARPRLGTKIGELDRVLGGGMVRDSFILLGGDPGVGKSTLLLQMAKGVVEADPEVRVWYVSGEESIEQIQSRAERLGVTGKGRIELAAETHLERVLEDARVGKPQVLIMDSLQTFGSQRLESAPGSVSQVREIAHQLMTLAKSASICVWLVGHVTKEGSIAGPKTVEHMVDAVLYFESESGQSFRLLRTVKNRFGSSRELGVFEMEGEGLREVTNPSALFLGERIRPVSGTAVAATLEGTRPLLVELQALASPSTLSMPRRTSVGLDSARLSLLAAIFEKSLKLSLSKHDLFVNVAGGLSISEPATDLAAAAAIYSSYKDRPTPTGWIWIGELSLTGEVRRVAQQDVRLREAQKLGFQTAVVPRASKRDRPRQPLDGLRVVEITELHEMSDLF